LIVLQTEKKSAQILEILRKHTNRVGILSFLLPIKFWSLGGNAFAGRIRKNKFWLILPNSSMAIIPYRFFFARLEQTDNKTIILGSFRYHPEVFIIYSIVFVVVSSMVFVSNFQFIISTDAIITSLLVLGFLCAGLLIGVLNGKQFEETTVEYISEVLAE